MPTVPGVVVAGSCPGMTGGRRFSILDSDQNDREASEAGCELAAVEDDPTSNHLIYCCPSNVEPAGTGIVASVGQALRAGWESLTAKQQAVGSGGTPSDPITQAVDQAIDKQVQGTPGAEQVTTTTQQAATMSPATKILIIGGVSTVVLGGLYLFYRSTRS